MPTQTNWCGFNCDSNPHRWQPYFPDGYRLPGNLENQGFTPAQGYWEPKDYTAGVANYQEANNIDFRFILTGPSPTPSPTQAPSPTPSATPIPSATPTNTPTPTPVQPTTVITLNPTPAAIGHQPGSQRIATQFWACAKTQPCNSAGSGCSGQGDLDHRVKLSNNDNTQYPANYIFYMMECLKTPAGWRCTSGKEDVDKKVLDKSYYAEINSQYGYRFTAFTEQNGIKVINQAFPNVLATDNQGKIGTYEWESKTSTNLDRLFMTVLLLPNDVNFGEQGGLQQTSFVFTSGNKNCVMIKWDPHGIVFDSGSLKPIEGASVTLLSKNSKGEWVKEEGKDIIGGLHNPVMTDREGRYSFFVPAGEYKLQVEKTGYRMTTDVKDLSAAKSRYTDLYDGSSIREVNKSEYRTVGMKKENIPLWELLMEFFK